MQRKRQELQANSLHLPLQVSSCKQLHATSVPKSQGALFPKKSGKPEGEIWGRHLEEVVGEEKHPLAYGGWGKDMDMEAFGEGERYGCCAVGWQKRWWRRKRGEIRDVGKREARL